MYSAQKDGLMNIIYCVRIYKLIKETYFQTCQKNVSKLPPASKSVLRKVTKTERNIPKRHTTLCK